MAINYDRATEEMVPVFLNRVEMAPFGMKPLTSASWHPSDTDFDGCVGINDFLVHLSFYGGCGPELAWACGDR